MQLRDFIVPVVARPIVEVEVQEALGDDDTVDLSTKALGLLPIVAHELVVEDVVGESRAVLDVVRDLYNFIKKILFYVKFKYIIIWLEDRLNLSKTDIFNLETKNIF